VRPVRGVSETLRGVRRHNPLWRRLLLALTLLAFGQASYLTQTHLHFPTVPGTSAAPGQSQHRKVPQQDDPAHCPICQEYVVAGAYISPAAIILPIPELTTFAVLQVVRELSFVATASHDWRGRAPPLH
jgi:hypothetical protein